MALGVSQIVPMLLIGSKGGRELLVIECRGEEVEAIEAWEWVEAIGDGSVLFGDAGGEFSCAKVLVKGGVEAVAKACLRWLVGKEAANHKGGHVAIVCAFLVVLHGCPTFAAFSGGRCKGG